MTPNETAESLKPCPFCGEERAAMYPPTCHKRSPYDPSHRAFPIVRCSCGVDVSGKDWDQSGRSAIAAWNRRAASPVMQNGPEGETRCPNCDGTGDVISFDGHWRARCYCPAGQAAPAAVERTVQPTP